MVLQADHAFGFNSERWKESWGREGEGEVLVMFILLSTDACAVRCGLA